MNFREYPLPTESNYAASYEIPFDTKKIIDIYAGIDGRPSAGRVEAINEYIDAFEGQQCFVVEEYDEEQDDSVIRAVANYRKEVKRDLGWIEGLAVDRDSHRCGIGRFAINNLVEVTRDSGLRELRLKSVPSAVDFYRRNSFLIIDGEEDSSHPIMSRHI